MIGGAEFEEARTLVRCALETLLHVERSLDCLDDAAPAGEQALCLAAAVEAIRTARSTIDTAGVQLADAAMARGMLPGVLDWTDGTPGQE